MELGDPSASASQVVGITSCDTEFGLYWGLSEIIITFSPSIQMKEYDKKIRGKANYISQLVSILSVQRKIKVNNLVGNFYSI